MGPPRPPRKCFYCFEMDHLFLFCPKKTEDEKKELILVDKFTVRFANGEPISMEHNMFIKDCVRKHLPLSIAVMMWEDPELETCSIWDQEPDIEGITNFIRSYLHQFFDNFHGLKHSLKPLKRPFDRYQSCFKAINDGRDIRQINW